MTRRNLPALKTHGDSGNEDSSAVEHALSALSRNIELYEYQNVFNADECGFCK